MSYSEFYQRSITQPESFWAEQAQRIDWQQPYTQVLDHSNPPFARWFCGGTTNLCHNAIDRWLEKQPDALALIAVSSETEEERTFTFRQLYDEVNVAAAMLLSLGVQRGDRVLVYMPMIAEAHITLLACARIGVIHSVVLVMGSTWIVDCGPHHAAPRAGAADGCAWRPPPLRCRGA